MAAEGTEQMEVELTEEVLGGNRALDLRAK